MKVISMVNLCGCADDVWNKGKDTPITQFDVEIQVQIDRPVESVFRASPDENMGVPDMLPYIVEKTDRGIFVKITIPDIKIWSMLCIHLCEEEKLHVK